MQLCGMAGVALGGEKNAYRLLMGNREEEIRVGRPKCRDRNDIKMDPREME